MILYGKWDLECTGNGEGYEPDAIGPEYFFCTALQFINDSSVPLCFHKNNKGILYYRDAFVNRCIAFCSHWLEFPNSFQYLNGKCICLPGNLFRSWEISLLI